MKVGEVANSRLVTLEEGSSLRHAAQALSEEEVGAVVVFGARGMVGVFSERDLARAIADEADLDEVEVGEYMTASPLVISAGSSLRRAAAKMDEFGVRHLVVLDGDDPISMISMRDIIHATARRSAVSA
ncbi:MAG TPA: CBS domain-containing protein [Actinomycetota bacterium]|nr:CBS domain-containing protein [Actinomycetota bacterium]